MSFRTRFGKWVIVACMGALAACTSEGDGGTVGADQLSVTFPNGTLGPFTLGRVTSTTACAGDVNDFFGDDPADATVFTTDLEVVNDQPNGDIVYAAQMDLLGDCQFLVQAFEPDGELFCVGGATANIQPGDNQRVDIMLSCKVSQVIDTGNADVVLNENNVLIAVGNFCPFLHSLEAIPEVIPVAPDPLQIPNPALDGSWDCASDADCVGSGAGQGCDNDMTSSTYLKCFPIPNASEFTLCGLDAADLDPANSIISSCGDRCDVDPDPGQLSFQCAATLADGSASLGMFSDPALGGLGQDFDSDPTTYNAWCSNVAIAPLALPPSVGYFVCSDQEPGVTVTITCCGGDGDEDCDKCKSHDVTCAGENLCEPVLPPGCIDPDPDDCVAKGPCNPNDGTCQDVDLDGREECLGNPGPGPGVCIAGVCEDAGLCDGPPPVVCDDDPNDCQDGGVCDPGDGLCPAPIDLDGVPCDTTASGPGVCEVGLCVGNCTGVDCDDLEQCTADSCDPSTSPGTCVHTPLDEFAFCDSCNAADCGCTDPAGATPGECAEILPGVCVTGQGTPLNDCVVPDLRDVSGNSITASFEKCLILGDPSVSGSMSFVDAGGGDFTVTGSQTLDFVIDVIIEAFNAQVLITTNSVTAFGPNNATGAMPGTLTLDALNADFNIDAAATGIVNCVATNLGTMEDVSDAICPIANLAGGDNTVPLPGDPGQRFFPPLNVGATSFELGAGAADPTGWYISNPPALAGAGSQFIALQGDCASLGNCDLSTSLFKPFNSLLQPLTVGFCEEGRNPGASCDFSFPTSDPVCTQ